MCPFVLFVSVLTTERLFFQYSLISTVTTPFLLDLPKTMVSVITIMEALLADHASFMMQAVKTSIAFVINELLISVLFICLLQTADISLMH